MQIRLLKWRGFPIWPPEWEMSNQGDGEEGLLEEVRLPTDQRPRFIGISANHLGEIRSGVVILDDPDHLEILYRKLQENIGKTLIEIGNLEIEFPPSLPKYGLKQARPESQDREIKRIINKK